MISSNRYFRTLPAKWLATQALLIFVTTAAVCRAQDASQNPLTPKYLIGDAVSLSNQEYPEIDKAIQRFRNRDVAGALEYLEKATEKFPKLAPADVMMAKMQLLARSANGVRLYLERAATNHPADPEAYLILAEQAFQGRRTTEAMALFEHAAPLVDKFTSNSKRQRNFKIRLLAGRSSVAERRKQWEAASEHLTQWLEIDPENAVAHTRMGVVLFQLDKAKESLASLQKAHEINPDAPHPFVSLGQLFYANGENDKARKSFEKAYNEDKSDTKVAQAFAEWLIQQGELDEAQKISSNLREQAPDSIQALLMDGIVAYMQGQSEQAESTLQKVLSLDPRNVRATDMLALLLIESDKVSDKERALQYAQNNAERLRNNARASVTRAYVLYQLGRKAEAQQSLEQAGKLQIRPDSTYLIAKILVGEGQYENAIAALEKVVDQKPGPLIFRREAKELLAQLQAGPPATE